MDPVTIMLLSQAIPTAINLGKSVSQGIKAKKLGETDRPQYEIPDAIKQSLNVSKYLASMRELPGQNTMLDRLGQTTSKGVSELKNVSSNPATLASNVTKLYGNQMDATNDIGIMAGQQWLRNQSGLQNELNRYGAYEDKKWNINEFQPYQDNMAASAALKEGAFRNLYSAGSNIGSGLSGLGNMKYQEQMWNKILNPETSNPLMGAGKSIEPSPVKMGMTEAINIPIVGPSGGDSQLAMDMLNKDFLNPESYNPYPMYSGGAATPQNTITNEQIQQIIQMIMGNNNF